MTLTKNRWADSEALHENREEIVLFALDQFVQVVDVHIGSFNIRIASQRLIGNHLIEEGHNGILRRYIIHLKRVVRQRFQNLNA